MLRSCCPPLGPPARSPLLRADSRRSEPERPYGSVTASIYPPTPQHIHQNDATTQTPDIASVDAGEKADPLPHLVDGASRADAGIQCAIPFVTASLNAVGIDQPQSPTSAPEEITKPAMLVREASSKFAMSTAGLLSFDGLDAYYGGLERILGPPSPKAGPHEFFRIQKSTPSSEP